MGCSVYVKTKTPLVEESSLRQETADGYDSERGFKSPKIDFKECITVRSVLITAKVKQLNSAANVLDRV